ncbi:MULTISPECIES: hypothetical protein [Arthrospira]|nr:hypothetical protein [Arthrospira platensis]KDR57411.1 hypothetical protein APPUASWS_011335 [Arthrospira platensis str. Paraca]MBD2671638.1 hypothetical protein [Arthrospira platensis FACHB-439]MBD2712559.1 hypothetical protein [Arthrospira platensis FACHB-835]MDF2211793.1 hypothetical protein [Arthrospira platensis NCB002]MDT9185222.1 hypothetical protein [Limnospira sp. PMC 289.06]MDT9297420.1 hypothetical protein [Arthrospira platensis PCC 7345]MDT9311160.1 hypothetical protein [Limnos
MADNSTETSNNAVEAVSSIKDKFVNIINSWQLKVGIVLSVVAAIGLLSFFWSHIVAELGMKAWSKSSGATPIRCMIRDTNGDEYVSCSAILNDQIVPLECGSSIFNVGCRINYGAAAAPAVRQRKP